MGHRLATTDISQKMVGYWCAPFCHVTWSRPTSVPIYQRYRQDRQTGQQSRRTGQTVTCNGRPKM